MGALITVPESQQQAFERDLRSRLVQATSLGAIDSSDKLIVAEPLVADLRSYARNVEEFFEEPISQANRVHKFLTGLRAKFADPAKRAAETLGRACADYRIALQREEQRRQEEARCRAEALAAAEN